MADKRESIELDHDELMSYGKVGPNDPDFVYAEPKKKPSDTISLKLDVDVSEAITGLKAIQREAKAATKALAELREEQQERSEIEYVVVVVDTLEQAQILESALRSLNSDRTRFQALHVGQAAVGWQFKGTRPTTVILAYSELKTDQEKEWEREVVNNLGYADDHPTRQTKWVSLL
ncbi:hypothetical protein [Bacillus glycinifermentans]|uniref:hypothetical protein n=1 Tax=Bacillus glycinifermentans TaxID=1664069 RepID=UPI001F2737C1|nr:hypothetical protein [Bacillus glycinifermentans]